MADKQRYSPRTLEALQVQIDALDRLLTAQLAAQEDQVKTALIAADKAIQKAEDAAEKRFDLVDTFRTTISDQGATYATRRRVDEQNAALREKIDDLGMQVSRLLISLLLTLVSVLLAALVFAATR